MPLKTPKFWYPENQDKIPFPAALLAPLSALYQRAHMALQSSKVTQSVPVPVICVGNITAGGSGKTPVCIAIAKLLKQQNPDINLFFLTRGYGGKKTKPRRIEGHELSSDVGDEPLILAQHVKTIVSPVRHEGARVAYDQGAQYVIMDDGLLNKALKKDISFMVIEGSLGIGNGKTIPSGPLREPFERGLNHADAIIIIGEDRHNIKQKLPVNYPVFKAAIKAQTEGLDKTAPYLAFAGIGIPQKFKNTLEEHGFKIVEFQEYPDHYPYTKSEIESIIKSAKNQGAKIITTQKDHVRVSNEFKNQIEILPIEIEWAEPEKLLQYLNGALT